MTALGDFVRRRRKVLGLTQAALALRMGVDDAYVSAIETGRRTPDGASFLDLLGCALELKTSEHRELTECARRSQRYVRLPEELPVRAHELFTALADDLPRFSAQEIELIASIHAAILRNRKMTTVEAAPC
ncbi:helix-turn-helix domain-containing protein [Ralstonia pickettii]|uniref:Helix-turn-helix domain-containing protein n=1 Tax=Ralstonia pickettii TaxID=329 RepID=A0A7X2HQ71_RALPI|nr:helix-turn-helix domain-containing protein [Ralstonia pickettii]